MSYPAVNSSTLRKTISKVTSRVVRSVEFVGAVLGVNHPSVPVVIHPNSIVRKSGTQDAVAAGPHKRADEHNAVHGQAVPDEGEDGSWTRTR